MLHDTCSVNKNVTLKTVSRLHFRRMPFRVPWEIIE